jgi:hypothetical protein
VCPWNSPKLVQATSERDYFPRVPGLSGSRPDPDAGKWLAGVDEPPEEAVAVLRDALEDEEPLVREHAVWALEQLE